MNRKFRQNAKKKVLQSIQCAAVDVKFRASADENEQRRRLFRRMRAAGQAAKQSYDHLTNHDDESIEHSYTVHKHTPKSRALFHRSSKNCEFSKGRSIMIQ